jgi:methyltransferase (TIGR00027 family)
MSSPAVEKDSRCLAGCASIALAGVLESGKRSSGTGPPVPHHMEAGSPSRTAFAAATHRAAHQLVEEGRIFRDPLALRILGVSPEEVLRDVQEHPARARMRLFIAMRTNFAEESLAAAVASDPGVTQLVVLGAGLDTFAYRNPFGERLKVFEVDHPATQEWKRARLAASDIALPAWLTFAPVDFERETLSGGLAAAGFDSRQRTFFTWLGVVPYLTEPAILATLEFIGALSGKTSGGAHVVFDYSDPPHTLSPQLREAHERRAARVAALGEAFMTYFEPYVLAEKLKSAGLPHIEDLGPRDLIGRYLRGTTGVPAERGGHVVHAWT